jgi:hypothetical protein
MPRPLKSRSELRQRFDLYLDEGEIERLRGYAQAARLPMSTYLRRVALRQRIEAPPPAANLDSYGALGRLANNLNQLVRACHSGELPEGIYPAVAALAEQVRLLRLELLGVVGDQLGERR